MKKHKDHEFLFYRIITYFHYHNDTIVWVLTYRLVTSSYLFQAELMSRDQVAEKKCYEIIHKNQEITLMYDPNNDNPYELMILMTLIKII